MGQSVQELTSRNNHAKLLAMATELQLTVDNSMTKAQLAAAIHAEQSRLEAETTTEPGAEPADEATSKELTEEVSENAAEEPEEVSEEVAEEPEETTEEAEEVAEEAAEETSEEPTVLDTTPEPVATPPSDESVLSMIPDPPADEPVVDSPAVISIPFATLPSAPYISGSVKRQDLEDTKLLPKAQLILEDVRMAWRSGAKIAQVAESDEQLQRLVESLLSPEDRLRIVWGGSTRSIVG